MSKFLSLILTSFVAGIVVLLCLLFCYASTVSDKYWEELKREREKKKK